MVDYTITGNNYANTLKVPSWAWNYDFGIYGNGGNDALIAGNGDDDLFGGSGNDTLIGGNGWNYLNGGTGYDTASYSFYSTTSSLGMYINLGVGEAWNRGSGPVVDDILYSIEGAVGTNRADVIIGSSVRNVLEGGSGNDNINGAAGDDDLYGDFGADILTGGTGYDYFVFDSVADSLTTARDRIIDFQLGVDTIDLSVIDADTYWSGNQAFDFVGYDTGLFSGWEGELRYRFEGGNTVVEGDTNGNGYADFAIVLNGTKYLIGSDFIL